MSSTPLRAAHPLANSHAFLRPASADTGDFAATLPDYAHYPSPLWCMAAVTNALEVSRISLATRASALLGILRPQDDTMPVAAATIARTCGARFTMANTAQSEWPDLFQLALAAGNDTLAQAVLTTLVTHAETPAVKAERLLWGVHTYLAAQPRRISAAEAAAAQLDAMGGAFVLSQVEARYALVTGVSAYGDRALLQREVNQLRAVSRGRLEALKPTEVKRGFKLWEAYLELLRVTWLLAPDSTASVVQQLQTAFSPPGVQRNLEIYCHLPFHYCAPPITVTPMEQIPLKTLTTAVLVTQGLHTPTPAPALKADMWVPPPQSGAHGAAEDTVQPATGRFSLIYHWSTEDGSCARFPIWGCTGDLLFLKALLARYGKELAVTMLVDADSLTALDVPDIPQAVTASYQWYFHTYLAMPVTVAVRRRKETRQFPAPDDRIFYGATGYDDPYMTHAMTLVNPQRQILMAVGGSGGSVDARNTGTLALLLQRELQHETRPNETRSMGVQR